MDTGPGERLGSSALTPDAVRMELGILAALLVVGPADVASVTPGEVIWRGFADGVDRRHGEPSFELSPDGRAFLYCQGPPWPRLMLRSLEPPDAEPVMLGTSAPLPLRAPRFHPDGRWVFFTVDADWRPRRPAPAGSTDSDEVLHAVVARIQTDGGGHVTLAPAGGRSVDTSAVLLDVHPVGDTVLVGIVETLRSLDARTGGFTMELEEVPVASPEGRRPLGFTVPGSALVRYSWDGRAVFYTPGGALEEPWDVNRYDRSTGLHRRLDIDARRCGRLAGEVAVGLASLAHPGSFGRDGFPLQLLFRSLEEPPVVLEPGVALVDRVAGAPRLHAVRDGRMLLSSGPADRLELVVARWDADAFEAARSRSRELGAGALDPGDVAARERVARGRARLEIAARAEGEAAALLARVRRSLVLLPGADIEAVRVRWRLERGDLGPAVAQEIEVLETVRGAVRIEKVIPVEDPDAVPGRDVVVFDGRRATFTGEDGRTRSLSPEALEAELAALSPWRLLLDPAGLGIPGLTFSLAAPRDGAPADADSGGASTGGERRLAFHHVDGFHGELAVSVDGDRALPRRLATPLTFESARMRRSLGDVPAEKTVTLDDWGPASGRMVPRVIRFDAGLGTFTLTLGELRINPEIAPGAFTAGDGR